MTHYNTGDIVHLAHCSIKGGGTKFGVVIEPIRGSFFFINSPKGKPYFKSASYQSTWDCYMISNSKYNFLQGIDCCISCRTLGLINFVPKFTTRKQNIVTHTSSKSSLDLEDLQGLKKHINGLVHRNKKFKDAVIPSLEKRIAALEHLSQT